MVTGVSDTSSTANSAASASGVTLAKNFDMFLTLLTTQLKNQDPTSPMDSKEFTQQLVQFSQVEQSINQNKNLEKLISLFQSQQSSNLVNYIGKQIDIDSNVATLSSNSAAVWYYDMPSTASAGEIRVIDKNGKVVHTAQLEKTTGEHSFVWNGASGSATYPPGDYKLQIVAKDAKGDSMTVPVKVRQIVDGVERIDGTDYLTVGNKKYEAADVLSLRAAPVAPVAPQDNGSYVNYIGKEIEFYGASTVYQNGEAAWSYGVGSGASTVEIKVYDSNNNLVYQTTGDAAKGRHDYEWDGSKSDGTTAQAGEIYKIEVTAKTADNQPVSVDVLSRGKVDSVAFENLTAMFSVGGLGVPPGWVMAVRG
ncbi:FlgD immunoglobulin-like domain containing protein [Ferrovibrio sp.]|uniref:FlgD immunoglobulin-like domain containing protein n=1 Tax=Ferrovibrio sp. TaxID=1917215 RepID=UPI00351346A5